MTPEERIKAAAEAVAWYRSEHGLKAPSSIRRGDEELARAVLARAYPEDFPSKPRWPCDESVIASHIALGSLPGEASFEVHRERLRLALLADPIIKAAVAWRKRYSPVGGPTTGDLELHGRRNAQLALARAIDEAGL